MEKKNLKVIISGGGTGGHIFPAIAIANEIMSRFPDAQILFVGAEGRMEMEKVPAAGYKIIGLPVSGFDRHNMLRNVKVLWRLYRSLMQARKIVKEFRPDIVVGVGGYASGPTLWAATAQGVPALIQEQNGFAGVTNKMLARRVEAVCVAYDGMERFFPADKIVMTGNPVRQALCQCEATREEAVRFFDLDPAKKTLLVIGGSLGARTINRSIAAGIDDLVAHDIQLIWQTGKIYDAEAKSLLAEKKMLPGCGRCPSYRVWRWLIKQPTSWFHELGQAPFQRFACWGKLRFLYHRPMWPKIIKLKMPWHSHRVGQHCSFPMLMLRLHL